jgi:hypothetical protein
MSEFKIVKDKSEIKLGKEWADAPDFKSKIVDEKSAPVAADYAGREYVHLQKEPLAYFLRTNY